MKSAARILLAMTILLPAILAWSQAPDPKPGPEVQKLAYFDGTWTADGDVKPGPMGAGGKMTGTTRSRWLTGGFFLESHEEFKGAGGDSSDLSVMGYDADAKVYTYHAFDNTGRASSYTGALDGDTWTWNGMENMGGQSMKGRYTVTVLTPDSYHFKFELSPDGSSWTTVMEGKATKSK